MPPKNKASDQKNQGEDDPKSGADAAAAAADAAPADPSDGKAFVVRTNSKGVFYGRQKSHKDDTLVLTGARRLWEWGPQPLGQVAAEGPHPGCKILSSEDEVTLRAPQLRDASKHQKFELSEEVAAKFEAHPEYRHA